MKKFIRLFYYVLLLSFTIFSLNSCGNSYNFQEDLTITNDQIIDSIVQLAIDETDSRLEDYIDIEYFSNLEVASKSQIDSIQTLSFSNKKQNSVNIDDEQYTAITKSITSIFNDLSVEEFNVFKELAKQDSAIGDMIDMIENGFEFGSHKSLSITDKKNNVVKLSAGVMTIGSILSKQRVCTAAIFAIKGAFNSMLATLNAFFIPNSIKGAIVTASILVIASVVVVNWNKIKPVFNQIVDIFVEHAKKIANTVLSVFNQIRNIAFSAEANSITNAVFNHDVKSNMGKYGLTASKIASLINQFTGVDINNKNNSNSKTVYLGCVEDKYYKYATNDYKGVSFHVSDPIWDSYVSKYTTAGLWLVNYAFLNYVIYKRWEIVLVTNPSNHYNLYTQTKLTTRMYASELEVLCKFNGASWHYEGPFWRVDKAW